MKPVISALLLVLLAGFVACQSGKEKEKEQQAPESKYSGRSMRLDSAGAGLMSPESVIRNGDFYYVSNLGPAMEPSRKDGDGYIGKLDLEGKLVGKFVEKLDAPKGMAIAGGKLYVADIDKIKAFDLNTGEAAGEIDFKARGTQFLNDIVKKSETELYVSATDINKIYTVNLTDLSATELVVSPTPQNPNGLWYDGIKNRLYVVGYADKAQGKIGYVDLAKGEYTTFTDFSGLLDGVALVEGNLVFTDWNRKVLGLVDLKTNQVGAYPKPRGLKGPADFYFDEPSGEFWIPAMEENAIYVQSL